MLHLLGIRHHGPGSARNVKAFLEEVKPDTILVEGPPEADDILKWVGHKELKPPVAILCYQPGDPQQSAFYPFVEFSPEWQAILYARKNNVPVHFMDLPISNQLALAKEEGEKSEHPEKQKKQRSSDESFPEPVHADGVPDAETAMEEYDIKKDPISYLAEAAGYEDGEKWWEQMFEHRLGNEQVFDAVAESMQILRENLRLKENRMEKLREAHMRKMIRQAEKDLFQNIVVICGAWHAPALIDRPKPKEDNDLLKGLPKVKVDCTWTAWTYDRLSYFSGYGAGIQSPGWYEHVWLHPTDDGTRWMTRVAQLFREKDMDTSVAHVIESVRLAGSLAGLRQYSKAGLEELNEATLSVLCNGDSVLLQLIHHELIVGTKLGEVPSEIPKPPLQVDMEQQQKSLRLPSTADFKDYVLDLRKETDLARSIFLHRLQLLELRWGTLYETSGKGTFKEQWRLQWDPAFSVDLIEKGSWGNTVEEAASRFVIHQAKEAASLLNVAGLLQKALPAELHRAVEKLVRQVGNLAAATGDVVQLIEVVPSLVTVSRYGNVRGTDAGLVLEIVTSMTARICVSLPNAVTAIDEEAARKLLELLFQLNDAVALLQHRDMLNQWQQTLKTIAGNKNSSPVIAGYATRLLTDHKLLEGQELINAFAFNMSSANAPDISAAWLEGFLKGSGTILLIDEDLWNVVNNWIIQLEEPFFIQVLPLLRRTFAAFSHPERRKLGEKVKAGKGSIRVVRTTASDFDHERAKEGIPVVLQMLGLA